jgi:hypothetical protein
MPKKPADASWPYDKAILLRKGHQRGLQGASFLPEASSCSEIPWGPGKIARARHSGFAARRFFIETLVVVFFHLSQKVLLTAW